MLPTGTVWETFNDYSGSEISFSHAWSAHPISHLPELIFGLEQLEQGWKKIRLTPECLLDQAEFQIPLPQGSLSAKIRKKKETFALEVTVPEGVTAEILLPGETIFASGETIRR